MNVAAEPLLAVCESAPPPTLAASLAQLCGRVVRVVVLADAATPGARRNRSLDGDEPLLTFLTESDWAGGLGDRVFLERACALLDREPVLGWVTAMGDGAAGWFGRVVPAAPVCARPLLAHAPLVLRRSAWQMHGFDASLMCGEEAELLLRLHENGVEGAWLADPAVRAAPFGRPGLDPLSDEAEAATATVIARHEALFFDQIADAVVGRERWVKELVRESQDLGRLIAAAEAELLALDDEARRLHT